MSLLPLYNPANPVVLSYWGFKQQSDVSGLTTVQLIVPGAFTTLQPGPTIDGRYIVDGYCWFDAPLAGDTIIGIGVSDPNGVIPVPAQPNFPSYPTLTNNIDVNAGSIGIPMPTSSSMFNFLNTFGGCPFIASQLALNLVAQKGNSTQDWLRGYLRVLIPQGLT